VTLEDKDYEFTSAYTYSGEGEESFSITATYGDCTNTFNYGDDDDWIDCP